MSISTPFDVNRVTDLENRLDKDEAIMITNDDTAQQQIHNLQITGATNSLTQMVDPATNGAWFGIMQDPTYYNLALGRFVTGSKAIEMRSYFDNLTFRTGRASGATSADINFITNDQVTAGISADINLMPRGDVNLCPTNGGTNTNGLNCTLVVSGSFPCLRSINHAISAIMLKFGSNGLHSKSWDDTSFQPFYGSAFNVSSDISFKENVEDYEESALDLINNTKVRKYNLKNDSNKNARIGLIRGESPKQLQADDDTLDLYQMNSMLWKAVQELSDQVKTLQGAAAK